MSWKLKFRFGNPYLVLKTPLSPAPNLHDYAHWIRPAIKPSYQPKKVWNRPTWVRTSFKAQCAVLNKVMFTDFYNILYNKLYAS